MLNKQITIMVVDDHNLFRNGLCELLISENFNVTAMAENGKVAVELYHIHKPDIILMDIQMPEMDGCDALEQLRLIYPDVKIIIVSQFEDLALIKYLFNCGAKAYALKRAHIEDLSLIIKMVNSFGVYSGNLDTLFDGVYAWKEDESYKLNYSLREREIINLLCKGKTNKAIAIELNISEKTVETHLTEIYKTTKVNGRSEFLIYAINSGLCYIGTQKSNNRLRNF